MLVLWKEGIYTVRKVIVDINCSESSPDGPARGESVNGKHPVLNSRRTKNSRPLIEAFRPKVRSSQSCCFADAHLPRKLCVMKPACVAESAGAVRTSAPFGGLGSITAVTAAWRCCFLGPSQQWFLTRVVTLYPSSLFCISAGETTSFIVFGNAVVFVLQLAAASHSCSVLRESGLLGNHNLSHSTKILHYSVGLSHHIVNFVDPGKCVLKVACAIALMISLSPDSRKVKSPS